MLRPLTRVEAHRVEIGDGHAPALLLQRGSSFAHEVGVEGLRFGMGENEMGVHPPMLRAARAYRQDRGSFVPNPPKESDQLHSTAIARPISPAHRAASAWR